MKRIVLTGPTGFLGRHSIPFLIDKGYEIHALDMRLPDHAPEGVVFHQCNLLDTQSVERLMKEIQPEYEYSLNWYSEKMNYPVDL